MMRTGHAPARLMFDWAQDHRRRLALWLVIALVLHAGAYFLFRIVQPVATPAPSLDNAIHFLAPGSPEAIRLAPFIAANDPSLIAPDRIGPISISDPAVPAYQPSYAAALPLLAPLPDPPTRLLPPIVRDIGPVPMPGARSTLMVPAPARDTQITFAGDLAGRRIVSGPDADFSARPGDQLPPATFLVEIDADGRVLHVFEQEGTGNRNLDMAAAKHLSDLRFEKAGSGAWGTATFHWGLDVKREEAE